MGRADLHIHTTASDGLFTPQEVLKWANIRRLSAISITDHDTVEAIEETISAAGKYNIEVIPGVELSSDFNGEEIHILGYMIDYKSKHLLEELNKMKDSRFGRGEKMIQSLNNLGVGITFKQVEALAGNGLIGRPHIARAMISNGYVDNMKMAFEKYIGKGKPAYVERYKLSSENAIKLIKDVGGISVLAHPGLMENKGLIGKLVEMGIRGIEVYHSKHDDETVRNCLIIAKHRNLLITGGSDCHGNMYNNEPILGSVTVDYKFVEQLKLAKP